MVRSSNLKSIFLLIFILNTCLAKRSCDSSTVVVRQCLETETCIPTADPSNGYCECLPGYFRVNNTFCENVTKSTTNIPKSSSLVHGEENNDKGNTVAEIFIPIFLITVVMCGAYFSYKFHVFNYIRIKLNQRNGNYDEVMIGQDLEDDDPPLR